MKDQLPIESASSPALTRRRKLLVGVGVICTVIGWGGIIWHATQRHALGHDWLSAFGLNGMFLRTLGDVAVPLVLAILLAQTAMRLPKGRLRTVARWAAVMAMVFVPIWWSLLRPMLLAGP